MYFSKSDFLKYQICPSYFWLWKHARALVPEETNQEVLDQRLEQGNEVERYARLLFPDALLVTTKGAQAKADTERLITNGATQLFQATVITNDGLLAMADVLEKDGDGWKLYEVKSTNTVDKKKHLPDAAFQKIAFEKAGYAITAVFIIHMNKEFVRTSEYMNPQELLVVEDVTSQIDAILPEIRDEVALAVERLANTEQPTTCPCRYLSKGQHCPTFSLLNSDVPGYSVYDISRMQGKKLAELVDADVLDIHDVPDGFSLSKNQQAQVSVAKSGTTTIDQAKIHEFLAELEYPIYFLDYESIAPALPFMNGTHPYQQNVFQYSLHILDAPDSELRHDEYLLQDTSEDALRGLVASMRARIGDEGSVVVWHKTFERDRNKELAAMFPEYGEFMLGLNERIFDLEDAFSKNYYVHPGFLGKSSIKYVLPVLAPQFSYKSLNIQKGDIASIRWFDCTIGNKKQDAKQVYADLLEYCGLDTLAMVEIYNVLRKI